MSESITLKEIQRRTGISYPALLRYRDKMLYTTEEEGVETWAGPLAQFACIVSTPQGVRTEFDPAAIPLFLRERRAGLAKRGRPPKGLKP